MIFVLQYSKVFAACANFSDQQQTSKTGIYSRQDAKNAKFGIVSLCRLCAFARDGCCAQQLSCRWRPGLRLAFAIHHIRMKRVLDVRRGRRDSVQSLGVGLVLGEHQRVGTGAIQPVLAELPMFGD